MKPSNYVKLALITLIVMIQADFAMSQSSYHMIPKNYLSERKLDTTIQSINERYYQAVKGDNKSDIDSVVIIDHIEYYLKLVTKKITQIDSLQETIWEYNRKGENKVIRRYHYDDQHNLICKTINDKSKQRFAEDWKDSAEGLKKCQKVDSEGRVIHKSMKKGSGPLLKQETCEYRDDGLIKRVQVYSTNGKPLFDIRSTEIKDTIRYIDHIGLDRTGNNLFIGPNVVVDLIKGPDRYTVIEKTLDNQTNKAVLTVTEIFDHKWNLREKICNRKGEIYKHKKMLYSDYGKLVTIKDLINKTTETRSYNHAGNSIFEQNPFSCREKTYDSKNNLIRTILERKNIGRMTGIIIRDIRYKQ